MKYMKIGIGQLQLHPENIQFHWEQIIQIIHEAKAAGTQLLLFPAFSVTGYLPNDITLFPDFYEDCQKIHEKIIQLAKDITIIWGSIIYQPQKLTPAVFIAQNQKLLFSTMTNTIYPLTIDKETITLSICQEERAPKEKIASKADLTLVFYQTPGTLLSSAKAEPETIIVPVPTLYLRNEGLAYSGKQIFVCPGKSQYILPQTKQVFTVPKGNIGYFSLEDIMNHQEAHVLPIENIYQRTIEGIRLFMKYSHLSKVVIGLSGGIDSALNACLYQQALGAENVFLVNMPSRYNSHLTQNLARDLSSKLGCAYGIFPIEDSVQQTINQLENTPFWRNGKRFHLTVSSFTGENIQARDRGSRLLAAIAQSIGGVFTANCNKTEITVGYATMYGDQAGFLAATGNLWKYEVYDLARYIDKVIYQTPVLAPIIDLKPSAELSPAQDITKGLGDPLIYSYHDKLFSAWEDRKIPLSLGEILLAYRENRLGKELGCEEHIITENFPNIEVFIRDLEKWWKAYQGMATVKKLQSPPVLIVHNPPRNENMTRVQSPYYSETYSKIKQL